MVAVERERDLLGEPVREGGGLSMLQQLVLGDSGWRQSLEVEETAEPEVRRQWEQTGGVRCDPSGAPGKW